MRRVLVALVSVGLVAASAAAAATPPPDAHDRAIAGQLAAKVVELQKVTTTSHTDEDRVTKALKGCKGLGKTPAQSFGVVLAMLPVLLIDVVNQIRPQLLELRTTIAAWHPHAKLFQQWLDAERASFDQILSFDNHGKQIDVCAAVKVMLAKNPSDARVKAVLGIAPSRIKALFSSPASKAITKLNPPMRRFLIAAGVKRAVAVDLTK
jgi:hypothetical protein